MSAYFVRGGALEWFGSYAESLTKVARWDGRYRSVEVSSVHSWGRGKMLFRSRLINNPLIRTAGISSCSEPPLLLYRTILFARGCTGAVAL